MLEALHWNGGGKPAPHRARARLDSRVKTPAGGTKHDALTETSRNLLYANRKRQTCLWAAVVACAEWRGAVDNGVEPDYAATSTTTPAGPFLREPFLREQRCWKRSLILDLLFYQL